MRMHILYCTYCIYMQLVSYCIIPKCTARIIYQWQSQDYLAYGDAVHPRAGPGAVTRKIVQLLGRFLSLCYPALNSRSTASTEVPYTYGLQLVN